jgi:GntR family transcriptional regulator, transcriptional repressor for pyruvate dehydrogenase complex
MDPVVHASVPDLVFDRLSDAILGGSYEPGEQLPPQRALADEFGVNTGSVRSALARLEQLRLVETRQGDGSYVLDWRYSGGLEALAQLGGVDETVVASLFEARRLLLTEAARLAARRRTRQQAAALRELADAVTAAPNARAALLADWAYMATLVESASNLVFQLIMNSVRELYLPHLDGFAPVVSSRHRLAALYEGAAEAIADGDADVAAEAIAQLASEQERAMRSAR